MSINRDIAILFANSHFPSTKELRVCDPMTGSGVRAVRYLLETLNVLQVVAADREPVAASLAEHTILLNQLENRATAIHSDAHTLLSSSVTDRFDIIDLDPFGSPTPFFESALRATATGGVIAATATDMGPLSGARPTACLRKYGVSPVRTEFEKEIAVRTLASSLSASACKLELGIRIAFSHATDHYARLYAVVEKGRKAANSSLADVGYLTYCPYCLFRSETHSISEVRSKCLNCGALAQTGGPFWLGPLWDRETVENMIRHTPLMDSSRLSEIQKLLAHVQEEINGTKFYYTTGALASIYNVKPASLALLIQSLRASEYEASRTHFNPTGFRTNASLQTIITAFRTIAEKSQA
jgi:tRNA (guanine26-N2/guanine27-N2)-dimethyltransferase